MENGGMISEIIWVPESDFRMVNIIIASGWKSEGVFPVDDSEDSEGYVMVEYYSNVDGSNAEIYYSDAKRKYIADIRLLLTYDPGTKREFMDAYDKCPEVDRGPDYADVLFRRYLYDEFVGRM